MLWLINVLSFIPHVFEECMLNRYRFTDQKMNSNMGHNERNPDFVAYKRQWCRPDYKSAQYDQHLCYSLPANYDI